MTREEIIDQLGFTAEEYNKLVAGQEGLATFDEFIDNVLSSTVENEGTIEDAIYVAEDGFNMISKEYHQNNKVSSLYELAELINSSDDYPAYEVEAAIEANGWEDTSAESDYDICSDGESRLVLDENSGEATVR